MPRRLKRPPPERVEEAVETIRADPRVTWFPVKHFSPACAWHLEQTLRRDPPVAVLVEGPDDATALIPHIVAPDTDPPLTVLSAYVDRKNRFGLNGVQSPADDVPARFRSWWPFTAYCPEYVALRVGHELGADLAFIDIPLPGRIPFLHARRGTTEAPSDHRLGVGRYFEALGKRRRARSFEELWDGVFEVGGFGRTTDDFVRSVLTFAWCARHAGGDRDDTDGTLTREGHMRRAVDQAMKAHPEGRIVVVTGAFHSVALPFTKPKRAPARLDRNLQTVVVPHSFRALARLYHLERLPAHAQAVWSAAQRGEPRPYDAAAAGLVVEVMRGARDAREGVSTADAVGGWRAAHELARLRGHPQVALHDLLDAVQLTFVKGDRRLLGGAIERAARAALVGDARGTVTADAGTIPLLADFHAQAKTWRLDLSGAEKTVRLDLHKQRAHRQKSAFLHQLRCVEIPVFGRPAFRGPDPVAGTDLHLITETWAVVWREAVDDRLLEVADRGASIAEAAVTTIRAELPEAADSAGLASRALLRCAQMMLTELFPEALDALETAVATDARFGSLVDALAQMALLHGYKETLPTQGNERVGALVERLFIRATLALPGLAGVDVAEQRDVTDQLQTLVRLALADGGYDADLMVQQLEAMVADPRGRPGVRGAGFGVLYAFGAIREAAVAEALLAYLRGTPERAREGGAFLDGLLLTGRGVFMRSRRLVRVVGDALAELEWDVFKGMLPDLRRAFTQFIPAELDALARQVGEALGLEETDPESPLDPALAAALVAADAQVGAALARWSG